MPKEEPKAPSHTELLGGKKKPSKSKKGKSKYTGGQTTIDHHTDGKSHTVKHMPAGGGQVESYSAADLAGVHAGLDKNLGETDEPEAGQDGAVAAGPAMTPPGGAA